MPFSHRRTGVSSRLGPARGAPPGGEETRPGWCQRIAIENGYSTRHRRVGVTSTMRRLHHRYHVYDVHDVNGVYHRRVRTSHMYVCLRSQ